FSVILGGAALLAFAGQGMWLAAATYAAFTGVVCICTIRSARMFLAGKVAEAGLAEKSEVVSLLLREHQPLGHKLAVAIDIGSPVKLGVDDGKADAR
ncbi:hypothetical protein ABTM62_18960, partial [Acinetobacter baumannii]